MSPVRERRLFMDIRPLRESPAFRRLWIGSGLSTIGSQMTMFAVALQVFTITHSSLAVGAVGLCSAVPSIVFGLVGGSITDAVDRRRLVLATSTALAAVSAGLAAQAFAGVDQVWLLYLLISVASLLSAVNQPARRTFLPRLLPPERLPAGTALNMLTAHGGMMIGPALAGVVAGAWGLRACYLIDALSFGAALYGVFRLPAMPPDGGTARPGMRAVAEGLRFIRGSRVLVGAFVSDLNATVLGMPMALFPAINAERFGGSPRTLGLLTSAVAVGGLIGSALSGPLGRVTRHGRAMLVAGAVWGVALAGFGLARNLWLALALLAVAGVADVLSVICRSTIVQVVTPDRYRGRVNAADFVVGAAFPQVGNFRAGAIGSLTTPTLSAVSGGLAVVVGAALIRLTVPELARYDSRSASPGSSDLTPAADASPLH
jgi:MFS family permease